MKSITISENTTEIAVSSFIGCTSAKSINITGNSFEGIDSISRKIHDIVFNHSTSQNTTGKTLRYRVRGDYNTKDTLGEFWYE